MAEVRANGVRLNYLRFGAGEETVVFIHGLIGDNLASYYFCVAPTIARHAEVILYDLRGHGRSERPSDGYSLQNQVSDLCGLLDELGVDEPVHIVGNSFGGAIGLNFAVEHPERVATLLLIDAHYAIEGWSETMAGALDMAAFGLNDQGVNEWFEFQESRRLNNFAKTADTLINKTTLVEDIGRVDPLRPEDLAELGIPVVALYGENSDLLDLGRDLESLLPDCQLHVIPGVGHFVLMEASKTVEYHLLHQLGIDSARPDQAIVRPHDFWRRAGMKTV